MNTGKLFPAIASSIDEKQKVYLLSFIMHLAIMLIFFATSLTINASKTQILSVALYGADQLAGQAPGSISAPPQLRAKNEQEITPSAAMEKVPGKKTVKSALLEENKPFLITEEDIAAPPIMAKESGGEGVSISTAESNGSATEMPQSVIAGSISGLRDSSVSVEARGTGGVSSTHVAEARFGERGAPSFLYQETPVYPMLARRLGKEGRVLLKLLIDADGKLSDVEVIEAAGYGFTEASVAAVKKSTYLPGHRDGVKITTRALLPISFRLQ